MFVSHSWLIPSLWLFHPEFLPPQSHFLLPAASAPIASPAQPVPLGELPAAFSPWISAGGTFGPVFSFLFNAEIPSISAALQNGSIMDGFGCEQRRKSSAKAVKSLHRQLPLEISSIFILLEKVFIGQSGEAPFFPPIQGLLQQLCSCNP